MFSAKRVRYDPVFGVRLQSSLREKFLGGSFVIVSAICMVCHPDAQTLLIGGLFVGAGLLLVI